MRKLLIVIAISQLAISGAAAQSQSATKAETLSLEQKTKISQMISQRTAPLASGNFSIAVDAVVPADVQVQSLPPRRSGWRRKSGASATSSSKSKLRSSISAPARSRSCFRDGGSHRRYLQVEQVSQRS
jgi:hypothetical protein